MSAAPLFAETEIDRHARILEEARASELRAVREALPIVVEFSPAVRPESIELAANRLRLQGYHVAIEGHRISVRGLPR